MKSQNVRPPEDLEYEFPQYSIEQLPDTLNDQPVYL